MREADECDVLLVLRSGDTGRVPGSATIEPRREAGPRGSVTIIVQSVTPGNLPPAFDARTTEALADFILEQMM